MMRHVIISLLFVLSLCVSGAVMAAPKEKSLVLHCGCTEAGDAMQYTEILISANSKGHDEHLIGSVDACFDGVETYTDFVRSGDDCQISGPGLGDPIALCGEQLAGDACGTEVVQ
jgi:hypothetical protein